MKLKVSEVKVGHRFREVFEGMEELKASIKKYGIIEPIVIDETNTLIAGERRLRAHKELGLEEIEVRYMNDLDTLTKKQIELEENIQRQAFTWQEEVAAKEQIHKIKKELFQPSEAKANWTIEDTATLLGEKPTTTGDDIDLSKGLKVFPELVSERNKSAALKKLRNMRKDILNEELARRLRKSNLINCPELILGDCLSVMKSMDAESVNLIITDPPWGAR